MNDTPMIADTTRRIFRELGNPQSMRSDADRRRLWDALETAGLTRTWIPESLNGSGATLADGFEVMRVAGEFAVNVPLAESMLGGWLLQQGGIATPVGSGSVAPVDVRDRITAGANMRYRERRDRCRSPGMQRGSPSWACAPTARLLPWSIAASAGSRNTPTWQAMRAMRSACTMSAQGSWRRRRSTPMRCS